MKLKVPPPIVFLFFALMMYGVSKLLNVGFFDFFGRLYLMYFLMGLAFSIGLTALIQFFTSKTTTDPRKPQKANKLVTKGLFQFTRNPMYLGLLLFLLAWGLYLGNAFNVITAALFVMYMNKFQIIPEEKALLNIFGNEYAQYCTLVRRWF